MPNCAINAARLDAHFRALIAVKEAAIVAPDRDNLDRYTDANRKVQPPNPKNPRVVFMGDSITDIWRLNEYFPDRDFINRGISGQVTSQMLARFKADVLDLRPDAVLILGGTNDLARNVPLIAIENNYQMMSDLANFYKVKVIFASVLPVSDYHKDSNPANERTVLRSAALYQRAERLAGEAVRPARLYVSELLRLCPGQSRHAAIGLERRRVAS